MAGRSDEAIAAAEHVVTRTRTPTWLGVFRMDGRPGRLADARRLVREFDARQSRGEYVVRGGARPPS